MTEDLAGKDLSGTEAEIQSEIREVVGILETGRERLRRLWERLPDPADRIERERDLDSDLDQAIRHDLDCVLNDPLRQAIETLRRLAEPVAP